MFAIHFKPPQKFAIGVNFNMIDHIAIRYSAFINTKTANVKTITDH